MIRPELLSDVADALGAHPYLAREDFVLEEYANREQEACLRIRYRYNSEIYFSFHIPTKETKRSQDDGSMAYRFGFTVRPGVHAVEEAGRAEERRGLLREISDWLGRLYKDVISAPAVRTFQHHESVLNDLRERLDEIPDEPFSRTEAQEFADSLDALRAEMANRLTQESADKAELKKRLDELSRDIEFLKATMSSTNKKPWGELLVVRLQSWRRKLSLRQLSAGSRVLGLLMPPGTTETLTTISAVLEGVADVVQEKKGDEDAPDSKG